MVFYEDNILEWNKSILNLVYTGESLPIVAVQASHDALALLQNYAGVA